jgi:hypothetical protein
LPAALVQERRCPQRHRTLTLQEAVALSGAMKSGRLGAGTPDAELTATQDGLASAGEISAAPAGSNAPVHRRARRTSENFFISTSDAEERQDCLTPYKRKVPEEMRMEPDREGRVGSLFCLCLKYSTDDIMAA